VFWFNKVANLLKVGNFAYELLQHLYQTPLVQYQKGDSSGVVMFFVRDLQTGCADGTKLQQQ